MRYASLLVFLLAVSCNSITEYSDKILRKSINAQYLNAHNKIRKSHGVPKIHWNEDLAEKSLRQAKEFSENCQTNIIPFAIDAFYQGWGSIVITPREVVERWKAEGASIYRQIVSRHTLAVGCAYSMCKDESSQANSIIHVCNYYEKPLLERILK